MSSKFLGDLDQWDEESQGILLSLAEQNQFISVEEIEKGILGKGESLFEKIILNEDDSNRMISPFYEKFGITESTNGNNLMLDTKVSEFNFTGKDENNQSTFAYRTIVHEISGSEVYKQYKTEKAGFDTRFLKLYYEKLNTERIFNFSGRFCLLNIGKSYYNNIISNFPHQGIVSYYGENKHSVYVNSIQSEVGYIKKVLDNVYGNNQLSENEILKALKLALWQYSPTGSIVNAIGSINDGLSEAVSLLASEIGKLKIAENGYLPNKPNYQPFLLKQANSSPTVASLAIGVSLLEKVIRKGIDSIEDYLDKINDAIPVGFRNAIRELTLFTNRLNEMIQAIMPILEDFGTEYFKLINAFVCGIINGLISLLEFIFQLISFGLGLDVSISSYDDYAERRSYLEVIEEALDFMLKSVPELLNGLENLIKTVDQDGLENLLQLITGLLGNVTRYELAYYGGTITAEIIIGVVLAVLTGGAGNIAKAVGSSQKLTEFLKILGREFVSSVTFGVSDLLAIFRNLIQSFIRACKNGFKGFLEWLRSLLMQDGRHLDEIAESIEDLIFRSRKYVKGSGDATKTFAENAGFKLEKFLSRTRVFGQSTDYTCAATSLKMVLDDRNIIKSEEYLAKALNTDKHGADILDIPRALYNSYLDEVVTIAEKKIFLSDLSKQLKEGDKAIVSVGTKKFKGHAIVLERIENDKVFLRDPLPMNQGSSYTMSLKDFEKIFNKKAVIIKK